MDTLNSVYSDTLNRLRSFKHSELKQIATGANLPEGTVRKIYYGEVKDPRVSTIESLHAYLLTRPTPELATLPSEPEHA